MKTTLDEKKKKNKSRYPRRIFTQQRDIDILNFIFKWRIASTDTIYRVFFPNAEHPKAAYDRLMVLERSGLVHKVKEGYQNKVWSLTIKGLEIAPQQKYAETLLKKSIKSSSIEHDLLIQATMLGSSIEDKGKYFQCFSENLLFSLDIDLLKEATQLRLEHRPDGLWIIPSETQNAYGLFLLEVELNLKSKERYKTLASQLSLERNCNGLIWIVRHPSNARKIQNDLSSSSASEKLMAQHFFLVDEIKEQGWKSLSIQGPSQGLSLFEILFEKSLQNTRKNLRKTLGTNSSYVYFQNSFCPRKSTRKEAHAHTLKS